MADNPLPSTTRPGRKGKPTNSQEKARKRISYRPHEIQRMTPEQIIRRWSRIRI